MITYYGERKTKRNIGVQRTRTYTALGCPNQIHGDFCDLRCSLILTRTRECAQIECRMAVALIYVFAILLTSGLPNRIVHACVCVCKRILCVKKKKKTRTCSHTACVRVYAEKKKAPRR